MKLNSSVQRLNQRTCTVFSRGSAPGSWPAAAFVGRIIPRVNSVMKKSTFQHEVELRDHPGIGSVMKMWTMGAQTGTYAPNPASPPYCSGFMNCHGAWQPFPSTDRLSPHTHSLSPLTRPQIVICPCRNAPSPPACDQTCSLRCS